MQSPYPVWQQLLMIAVGAPLIGAAFAILARGQANMLERGGPYERAIARQRKIAIAFVGAGWIVGFGEFIVVHFILNR